MGTAGEHVFNRKSAAPALIEAMQHLAGKLGRTLDQMDQITLGEAYSLAVSAYGENLPEYWHIWNSWNTMADEPRPMGEL